MLDRKTFIRNFMKVKIAIFIAILTFSCENDLKQVQVLTQKDREPEESGKDVRMIYSDSGRVEFVLTTPELNKYFDQENYTEFPQGIKIESYNDSNEVKSTLTAKYAINYESKKIMEAKSNVVINNYENDEVIETERIVWDQLQGKIYSDVFIKRTNKDGVMYGDGFDADEQFVKYTIRNPRATLYFDEE